jgi:hypothetical protein
MVLKCKQNRSVSAEAVHLSTVKKDGAAVIGHPIAKSSTQWTRIKKLAFFT